VRDRRRPRLLAGRDPGEGGGEGRGADRPDRASGRARAGPQRPGCRGRPRPGGDLGPGDGGPRRRLRLLVRLGRPLEQALPLRLVRTRRLSVHAERSPRARLRPIAIAALLLGAALVTWVVAVDRMRGMDAGPGTDLGTLGWYLGVWVTMMAAMMLPSVAPMAIIFGRISR